jgi:hypothetical protein
MAHICEFEGGMMGYLSVTILLLSLLAHPMPAPAQSPPGPDLKRPMAYAAAVQGEIERYGGYRVLVDPRPIETQIDGAFPDVSHVQTEPEAELRERKRVVAELGIQIVDALPMRTGCTGLLVPPPTRDRSGCPDAPEVELIFGTPSTISGQGLWKVPVVTITYEPSGRSVHISDLFVRHTAKGWVTVERRLNVAFD